MYLLSNMSILGIYVQFWGVIVHLSSLKPTAKAGANQ